MERKERRKGGIDYSSLVECLPTMLKKSNKNQPTKTKQNKQWSPAIQTKETTKRPIDS